MHLVQSHVQYASMRTYIWFDGWTAEARITSGIEFVKDYNMCYTLNLYFSTSVTGDPGSSVSRSFLQQLPDSWTSWKYFGIYQGHKYVLVSVQLATIGVHYVSRVYFNMILKYTVIICRNIHEGSSDYIPILFYSTTRPFVIISIFNLFMT